MNWVEANGISQRYELAGRADDVVVLVHEMGGMLESWDEALPGFQQHFRTLRYDQRGFGMSEKPRGKVTMDDLVCDLAGLLDALGITAPCHIVAPALGTAIAMAFAARHPKRIARMALSSPVTGTRPERRESQAQRAATIEREGMRAYMDRSLATSYPDELRGDRERFERFRRRWVTTAPASYVAMAQMVAELEITAELANIACPTLVIGAKRDIQRPPALAKEIAEKIRGARYVEVDSGHFMNVQAPELYVQTIVPFLRGA